MVTDLMQTVFFCKNYKITKSKLHKKNEKFV